LIGVLLLHRTLPADAVIAGMAAAAALDSVDPDLVAVEARRAQHRQGPCPTPVSTVEVARPAPSLAGYDQLLSTGVLA
jgi:hypothetical protein